MDIKSRYAGEWAETDPILRKGEPGFDRTVARLKMGDGKKRWSELPYLLDSAGMSEEELRAASVAAVQDAIADGDIEVGAGELGDWATSRAADVTALPRLDDRPIASWTNVLTTGLTSPVEYKLKGVGGGTKVVSWNGQDDPTFAIWPGLYETANGANGDLGLYGLPKPDANSSQRWPLVFEFTTSAVDKVEVSLYGLQATQNIMFEVNGRMVDDSVTWAPATFTGNNNTVTLTFPTAQSRRIRVWTTGSVGVAAIRVPTGGTLTKPTLAGRRIAFVGDSYVNGAGESRNFPNQGAGLLETFAPRLGRMMGAGSMILAGIGGSGWTAAGLGSKYASRLDDIAAMSPDVLVIYGSINDGAGAGTIATEVAAGLAAVAAVPEVYVIGPLLNGYDANHAAVKAATEAAGRTFIDMQNFLYGTGRINAPAGNGNRDIFLMEDNAHPTLAAHRAIARRAFALISEHWTA